MFAMMAHGLATDFEGIIMSHVSVHSMNNTHDFKTLRVTISVRGKGIQVLIDTGNIYNF